MKTMCSSGCHHNGNSCTWAHDVPFIKKKKKFISRLFFHFSKMPYKSLKKELDVIILTYFVNIWCMFKTYFLEKYKTNKVISTLVFRKTKSGTCFQ